MPLRPLLIFPKPVPVEREKLDPAYRPAKPFRQGWQDSHVRQPLQELQTALARRSLVVSHSAPGVVAEEVLVLETIGNVIDFVNAVRKIPGMEWLVSFDENSHDEDAETASDADDDDAFAGPPNRLFAIATNAAALNQLLSLWNRHLRGESFERGLGAWKLVFAQLAQVRRWDVADRLYETGVIEFWREALQMGVQNVKFVVEFWFRASSAARGSAFQSLQALAASLGGSLAHPYEHEPTAFHAAIATLPATVVGQFLNQPDAAAFLQRTEVMFCRPQGQTAVPLIDSDAVGEPVSPGTPPTGDPVAALLDGLPMENHAAYAGWLQVDDPDDWASEYAVADRQHGTGMASLIVRGDLSRDDLPLASPLYVRPILKPDPADWHLPRAERVPDERFPQDLLEIAIRRLKSGNRTTPPVAGTVQVVNLSVGDASRLFDGAMSPWARMVDYLAWQYNLLFIISAGNHSSIQMEMTLTDWEALAPLEREREALLSCWRNVRHRRLLSPAEAINAVTVAAQHSDESGTVPPLGSMQALPIQNSYLTSTTSAFGPGNRRGVKPDIAFPGGQQVMTIQPGMRLDSVRTTRPPGQRVAVPTTPSHSTGHTRGTSNSAALATRQAVAIIDALRGLGTGDNNGVPEEFLPVLAKTMLAHAASASDCHNRLRDVFDPGKDQRVDLFRKRHVTSRIGYGSVDPVRAIGADSHRATLIGWGELKKEEAHEFYLPLPASLNAIRGKRRLTFTLAWFSPINPQSRAYRCARLWLSPPTENLGTGRSEAEWRSVRNGTLQHEIWEGESAVAFTDGANLVVRVNCREDGGKLAAAVRYGLAVSIEAAVELRLPIYEEVSEAIAVRPQIRAA